MSKKKTLRQIRRMKPNDEMTVTLNDDELDIICIEKRQYLIFTTDCFYEMNYDEIMQKYQ